MRSLSWRLTLRVIAVLSWIVAIVWLIVDPGFEPLLAFLTGAAAFLGSFAAREDGLTPEQRQRNRRAIHDSTGGALVTKPSITGTTHTLPFHQLSPRDFERLCLWLVQREGFDQAEHLGAAGKEQGRDIVAWREGQLWAFQCKRVEHFYPNQAETGVDKVLELPDDLRPAALIFLVACDVSDETRNRARARCGAQMECHFWALTELDERVNRHADIVERFFQVAERNIIQRILGTGPDERRALRNRRAMLELVRSFWVEGVLEQSLHSEVVIELDMEEKPGAVEHPWDMVLQTEREDRALPPGTRIIDVFDEMGGNLLILGEPGSGKTTMLLELARDTIARAGEDPTHPIPVVFNLSSWADERQPIAEWLVDELNTKYNIPKKVARPWVECDELLLLLDGLDEVDLKCREDCVRAINKFRQDHLVPLVVCSRVADYEAMTARLRLPRAVLLQPLTAQQIDEYLGGAGVALLAVRETLQDDPTLQELAETPLMLSIMTLAYQGVSVADLQALDTVEARRQHLFGTYVQRMFERRGADQPYAPRQTIHWLAWLAQKMSEHAQSVFLIEGLQPDWLAAQGQRQLRIVARLGVRLVGGLFSGLILGLIFGLGSIEPIEALKWSWREAKSGLRGGLVSGLVGGLFGGLSGVEIEAKAVPNQGIRQSAKNALIAWLVFGLFGGLVYGLVFGQVLELFFGLVGGLLIGLIGEPIVGLRSGLVFGLALGLVGGLDVGLVGAMFRGGEAVILHLALRHVLYRKGYLPWNLVRFLDYATERIFLRKVGGGYIFIHRLLQDYFASLYQDQ
jgi:hypothetical protein